MKNKVTIIFFIFMLVLGFSLDLKSKKKSDFVFDQHTALLLIDIQNFYFPGGEIPLQGSVIASQMAKKVLDFFRQDKFPVIHVKHIPRNKSNPKISEDPAWNIYSQVAPHPGEKVIVKHFVNCFRETDLLNFLKRSQIRNLVICGMQTHMCLEAGVRAAADFGFSVIVINDACASRDLLYGDTRIPAHLVHVSTLATLKSTYARVLSSDELIAEQKEEK